MVNIHEFEGMEYVRLGEYEQLEKALAEASVQLKDLQELKHAYGKRGQELDAANKCVSDLESNRCDHCDAKINLYPCNHCGAPQCCPKCCEINTLQMKVDALEKERDELKKRLHHNDNAVKGSKESYMAQVEHQHKEIAKLKSLIADWKIEEEAWKETEARLTQSNDAMREGINDFLNVYKEEGIVKFHYLEDAIQKEEEK